MSKSVSTDEFLDLVSRSGLLDPSLVDSYRSLLSEGPTGLAATADAAHKLVDDGLLTPFQSRELLHRRFRGFFISDKYKILHLLGKGGMGVVVLCEHLMLARLVAVKLMDRALETVPGAPERFLREARAAAALDHPNIARVFDADRSTRGPYMVMEYVDGVNLHELVAQHGPLSPERAAHYLRQAAEGLEHAHRAGLVHRDLKPSNLMLDRAGTIKLLDLGLARFFDNGKNGNLTNNFDAESVMGTVDFIAPEQAIESHSADIRADIYSLGCTAYFLLARRLPAGEGTVVQKLLAHQSVTPEPLCSLRPEIPAELAAVIEKMMAKKPADRYQTPAEVAAALAPWSSPPPAPPMAAEMPHLSLSSFRLGLAPAKSNIVGPAAVTPAPVAAEVSTESGGLRRAASGSDRAAAAAGRPGAELLDSRFGQGGLGHDLPDPSAPTLPPGNHLNRLEVRRPQRRLWLALAGGAVGLLAAVSLAWLAFGPARPPQTPPGAAATALTQPGAETAAATTPGPAAPARLVLRGGGSTFVKPILEHWARLYEKETGVKIEYTAVGSSKGIDGVTAKFLDFGCTDAFLSDQQLAEANGPMLHIPLVMGAVVPTYNVPDESGSPITLRFTGPLLANIFLGKVKKWNDQAIAVSNPGQSLPDLDIVVVHRKEGSGTTSIWTDYLSKASAAWKKQVGSGTKVNWPLGLAAEKNDGVADTVSRTAGAIGYVEFSFALANGLPVGLVKNKSGVFTPPSIEGITGAAAASLHDIPADLRYSLTDAPGQASYPIVGTAWAVLYVDQPSGKGEPLVKFLTWATGEGQKYATDLRYGRLPPELAARVQEALLTVSGAPQPAP